MGIKLRRNLPLIVLAAVVVGGLVLGLGNSRIIAYTSPGSLERPDEEGADIRGAVDLFDGSLVHRVEISMAGEDYASMLKVYRETGEKEYFHASVTIDGVTVNDVGVRLKGNASLRQTLGGGGMGAPAGQAPGGVQGVENSEIGNLAGGNPETQVPLLIKFDEFVGGQTFQGRDRLAIRSAGTRYNAAMLQEPLTNHLFRLMGLPATRTAYAGISLNGGEQYLYTLSEVIEETYLEAHFENGDGILYKGEVRADLSYQGEDPTSYTDSFEQQTRRNDGDLAPLIDFIQFISESDDETFERELPSRLDVDAFAAYLAINALLVNNDSMAGMGNNYYLYYDDQSGLFTVLMWDANESLGTMGGIMGAPSGGGGQGQFPGGGPARPRAGQQPFAGGGVPPEGVLAPGMAAGGSPTRDSAEADIYPSLKTSGGGERMGGEANLLLRRFMTAPSFKALYEEKVVEVVEKAFASGAITAQMEEIAAVVRAANEERAFVDADAYDQALERVRDFVARRGEYLAGTELVKAAR